MKSMRWYFCEECNDEFSFEEETLREAIFGPDPDRACDECGSDMEFVREIQIYEQPPEKEK